jgi:hypothetical protein
MPWAQRFRLCAQFINANPDADIAIGIHPIPERTDAFFINSATLATFLEYKGSRNSINRNLRDLRLTRRDAMELPPRLRQPARAWSLWEAPLNARTSESEITPAKEIDHSPHGDPRQSEGQPRLETPDPFGEEPFGLDDFSWFDEFSGFDDLLGFEY